VAVLNLKAAVLWKQQLDESGSGSQSVISYSM